MRLKNELIYFNDVDSEIDFEKQRNKQSEAIWKRSMKCFTFSIVK